ncbi:MAG TPA: NnrU family protein, partial [Xanthobacteraceae bacterium]
MGLPILVAGLALFLGTHAFLTLRDRRATLIARIGEGPYKAL